MSRRRSARKRSGGEGKTIATITDTLETVFKLTGIQQLVAGMDSAAGATKNLATASASATAASGNLNSAISGLLPILGKIAGTVAIVKLGHDIGTAFGESELAAVRIGVTMKNLGNVFPTAELLDFASALSRTTGLDDELIATLGATAAQFGLNRQQIEKMLPTVLDVAQIKGIDPTQVLQTLLRASRGRPQGLVALGIDPSKIKGDLKDINNLISQVGKGFAGGAAAVRGTLPGTIEALKTSIENLFEAIGKLFADTLVKIINLTTKVIELLSVAIGMLPGFHFAGHGTTFTPVGAGEVGNNSLGLKGDPEHTKFLRDIANNTDPNKQADALAREVLGGAGTVAAGAVNWRDLNMHLGV